MGWYRRIDKPVTILHPCAFKRNAYDIFLPCTAAQAFPQYPHFPELPAFRSFCAEMVRQYHITDSGDSQLVRLPASTGKRGGFLCADRVPRQRKGDMSILVVKKVQGQVFCIRRDSEAKLHGAGFVLPANGHALCRVHTIWQILREFIRGKGDAIRQQQNMLIPAWNLVSYILPHITIATVCGAPSAKKTTHTHRPVGPFFQGCAANLFLRVDIFPDGRHGQHCFIR